VPSRECLLAVAALSRWSAAVDSLAANLLGLLATFAAWILWVMLRPQPIVFEGTKVPNPLAIQAVAHPGIVGAVLAGLNFLTASAAAFASVLAPFVRWRRAGPQERRQLMWLAFVVVAWPVCLLATLASYAFLLAASSIMAVVLLAGAIAGIPVAVGIAILRHRLYDIDRLINRTVVYGLLTALLGAVYAGLVLVLGQLFGAVGDQTPSWAVAGATLAVAALFQPARRRIQAVVDRRFNRRRFNAAKIVEAFSLRLREEVDLDALSAELLAVVDQTMQPTKASLWLRPPIERMRSTGV
jgi:MFS family permease